MIMSNKAWDKLNPLDQLIQRTARCGMTDGTVMCIEFISGFEKFNTRPYHNYETWGQGYRVTGLGVQVEREDLDDAILEWSTLVGKRREGYRLNAWETYDKLHNKEYSKLLDDWIMPDAEA